LQLTKRNPLHDAVIAFVGDLPPEFDLNRYIDKEAMFERCFIKPLHNFIDSIGWDHEKKVDITSFFS
jgi:hypothetical protein